jgi:sRNA-binding protein
VREEVGEEKERETETERVEGSQRERQTESQSERERKTDAVHVPLSSISTLSTGRCLIRHGGQNRDWSLNRMKYF